MTVQVCRLDFVNARRRRDVGSYGLEDDPRRKEGEDGQPAPLQPNALGSFHVIYSGIRGTRQHSCYPVTVGMARTHASTQLSLPPCGYFTVGNTEARKS